MRIEDLRNMLKDSNKELITMNGFKSTVYLKSLVALEHDPDVRLKNSQREAAASESHNYLQQGRSKKPTGIRYSQYAEMFTHARPALFNMLLGFFSGHSCWQTLPKLEFADDIHFVISTLLKLFNINRQKKYHITNSHKFQFVFMLQWWNHCFQDHGDVWQNGKIYSNRITLKLLKLLLMNLPFGLQESGKVLGQPFLNAICGQLILIVGGEIYSLCSFELQHLFHLNNIFLHTSFNHLFGFSPTAF